MAVTRKQFLQAAAGGTVVLLVQACGGGGGSSSSTGMAGNTGGAYGGMAQPAGCGATTITNNHGHALSIPFADLDSTTAKVYSIAGTAGHDHMITLTAAELAMIKAGGSVTVTSTTTNVAPFGAHSHDVTVNCM